MIIKRTRWSASDTEEAILCDYHGDGTSKTYTVHPHMMPPDKHRIAELMNSAYEMGIRHAQLQVRPALGMKS